MSNLKPSEGVPKFASNNVTDPTSGQNNVVPPTPVEETNGLPYAAYPDRQNWNWFGRMQYKWLDYVDKLEDSNILNTSDFSVEPGVLTVKDALDFIHEYLLESQPKNGTVQMAMQPDGEDDPDYRTGKYRVSSDGVVTLEIPYIQVIYTETYVAPVILFESIPEEIVPDTYGNYFFITIRTPGGNYVPGRITQVSEGIWLPEYYDGTQYRDFFVAGLWTIEGTSITYRN